MMYTSSVIIVQVNHTVYKLILHIFTEVIERNLLKFKKNAYNEI